MKSSLNKGQLTTWKDDRGFGFIQPANGGQEVFLHISELKDSTRQPKEGDTIYYYAVVTDGKIRACDAFILGARKKSNATQGNKSISNRTPASQFPILQVSLLAVLPLAGSIHFAVVTTIPIPIIFYPAMSLLTYVLYADDKSRAKQRKWRIPEKTLHTCELAGGWLGGLIAQRILHHKSSKKSYQFIFWTIVALHHIAWLSWLFLVISTKG